MFKQHIGLLGIVLVVLALIALSACGAASLTPAEQHATATAEANQKIATFAAQPADIQKATMDAVMATIDAGLK